MRLPVALLHNWRQLNTRSVCRLQPTRCCCYWAQAIERFLKNQLRTGGANCTISQQEVNGDGLVIAQPEQKEKI
jgi:hypothetical protein